MHITTVRVRYGETDQAGVAYHANYLSWFEVGRTEMLRALGQSYASFERREGRFLTVVEAHLRYLRPARYDDLIEIGTWPTELGRVRFRLDHRLRRQETGEVICLGHIVLACIDRQGRPGRLPSDLRSELQATLQPADGKKA